MSDEREYKLMPSKHGIVYVTVYEVTMHYGGPEEGGWWFDWWRPLRSWPRLDDAKTEEAAERLRRILNRGLREYHSVLGGIKYCVVLEGLPKDCASTETPHYE